MARIDEHLFEAWAASENLLQAAMRQLRANRSPASPDSLMALKSEANQRFMALWNAGAERAPEAAA